MGGVIGGEGGLWGVLMGNGGWRVGGGGGCVKCRWGMVGGGFGGGGGHQEPPLEPPQKSQTCCQSMPWKKEWSLTSCALRKVNKISKYY